MQFFLQLSSLVALLFLSIFTPFLNNEFDFDNANAYRLQ